MDYNDILKRAWQIVWHNKFMFILGFLAALGSSCSGGGNSNFNLPSSGTGSDNLDLPPGMVDDFGLFWAQYAGIIIALICLLFILGIIFWLLSLVGQTGLITTAARVDADEKVTFSEAFSSGISLLGKLVGLNLVLYGPFILLGLIAFGITLAVVGPAAFAEASGRTVDPDIFGGAIASVFICLGLVACLLVPLVLLVNVIYPFAQRGLILQGHGIVDSIRHGWQIIRDNVADVLLLILLYIVLGIGFAIASAIVLVPLALLIFLPNILLMVSGGGFEFINIAFIIGGGICLGLLAAAINSVMIAYRSTAVTLAYQQFLGRMAPAEAV